MWHLDSPNGRLRVEVWLGPQGGLHYRVVKNNLPVIEESALGISTSIGEFTQKLVFVKREDRSIYESYSLPAGKKALYENNAEEMALHYRLLETPFILRVRAFDEGMAFRYEIPEGDCSSLFINHETTEFHFPSECDKLWLQDLIKTYEGPYTKHTWEDGLLGQDYGMPGLFHASSAGIWMLVNEANVLNTHGSYCSCHLIGTGERKMAVSLAPEEKGKPISSPLPFQSPWRLIAITDNLDELLNTTLNYNLNPPSVIEDTSWIKPGRTLWAWWEYENGAQLYTESKSYVDFAAAVGFEAVTLDCAWDISWLKEFCEYAHEKNVKVWVWTGMQRIDTPEKAQTHIPLWAKCGVDGLKVDFFENDSRHTMEQYNMIADLMIRHKLMINFHGATKPMGEGRTWPNFITSEGILGLEHYKWSNMPNALHNCTVPFTRNVAGPMDYTPVGLSNANRNTTPAHQLALPVVFESGATHYSMSLYYMEAWAGTRFLRRTKAKYDGLKVLSGFPGDHAAILRYVCDEWLIGVITVNKQTVSLKLDFLPEGEFEAEIYEDDDKGETLVTRLIKVGKEDMLSLNLLAAGGAAIYIARKIEEPKCGISTGYMSDRYQEYPGSSAKMLRGSEPVRWSQELNGLQLNGAAAFEISVKETKRYTLRFFYASEGTWELEAAHGPHTAREKMVSSSGSRTFITHELSMVLEKGESRLFISRLSGAIPSILKMRVIDNDPPEVITLGAEKAVLTGEAELIRSDTGEYEAVGLGLNNQMCFENVVLPKDGKYVLRVDYCGGESRDISIEANEHDAVHTYLHSTAGWGFPVWNKQEGKEILIPLKKGKNTIRLFNDKGPMSHIRGIAIIPDHGSLEEEVCGK
jgi:alpha-glucosidase